MCVASGICNYCEQNEAGDIEHIYPKSFFPTHTFNWDNYILACKQCNTGYKLDKGFVIDEFDNLVPLERGTPPPDGTLAFINIRAENPEHFMLLNLKTFKFVNLDENTIAKHKAEKTIEILELNTRDTLIAQRKVAYNHYFNVLERLTRILSSNSLKDFEVALHPADSSWFDLTLPLNELKSQALENTRQYITQHSHPSVWSVIKIQESRLNQKWITLFSQVPEALDW